MKAQEMRKYRERHPNYNRESSRKTQEKYRKLIFDHYGWQCKMCGRDKNLVLDHINENGNEHRKELGIPSGWMFYRWVVKNGYPDDLQTLCRKCNRSKTLEHISKEVIYAKMREERGQEQVREPNSQ
jgi:5-methylcytosine-specific restriction endonuclease McrA